MLKLIKPELEDYWYEQKLQSDPKTMSYNAGYDVSYYGYHYDTGCIDFPKDRWLETYNKRKDINNKKYFYYLKDMETNEFVGYANYHYNSNDNRYECGILIEYSKRGRGYSKEGLKLLCENAKDNGITELYDSFEKDREGIKMFFDLGFEIVQEISGKKFNKDVQGLIIRKIL